MKNILPKIIGLIYLILIIFIIIYIFLKYHFSKAFLFEGMLIGTMIALIFTSLCYFINKISKKYYLAALTDIIIIIAIFLSFYFVFFKYPINEYHYFIDVFLKILLFYCIMKFILSLIFERLNFFLKIFLGIILPILLYFIYSLNDKFKNFY